MNVRIAIATSSGKVVDEHFGRAEVLHIVDLDEKGSYYIEKRETARLCRDYEHSDDTLEERISLLSDCNAVLTARAGPVVKRELEIAGISVFEIGLPVDEALEKLRQYHYKERGRKTNGQEN